MVIGVVLHGEVLQWRDQRWRVVHLGATVRVDDRRRVGGPVMPATFAPTAEASLSATSLTVTDFLIMETRETPRPCLPDLPPRFL